MNLITFLSTLLFLPASVNMAPMAQQASDIPTMWGYVSLAVGILALAGLVWSLFRDRSFGIPQAVLAGVAGFAIFVVAWTGVWCSAPVIHSIKSFMFGPGNCGAGSALVGLWRGSTADMDGALMRNPDTAGSILSGLPSASNAAPHVDPHQYGKQPPLNQQQAPSWSINVPSSTPLPTATVTPLPSPTPTPTPEMELVMTSQLMDPVAAWATWFTDSGYGKLSGENQLSRSAIPQGVSCTSDKSYWLPQGKGTQSWTLTCMLSGNILGEGVISNPQQININGFTAEALGVREDGATVTGMGAWEELLPTAFELKEKIQIPLCSDGRPAEWQTLSDGRETWSCVRSSE